MVVLRKIKSLGYLIKLDTNGTNPHIIKKLNWEQKKKKKTKTKKKLEKMNETNSWFFEKIKQKLINLEPDS